MTQQNKTPGAILYTRVSTGDQDRNGTSPETQLQACRQKALALGLPIVAERHDGGVSGGFLLTRAGMQAALSDITEGRADTLICANLSRYSRDVGHQQQIKKAVRGAGGRLVFCDMDFDDTPEGDLAFNIMGGFAEYEKSVIKKRTMAGREARARSGVQTARVHSPMGYHIVSTADVLAGRHPAALRGTYLIVEEEAALVRDLFARYAGGESLVSLARRLNEAGVPTRLRAAFWRINAIRYILSNPTYKGLGAFGKRDHAVDEARVGQPNPLTGKPMKTRRVTTAADPGTWITWEVPPLVSGDVWEAVQAKFGENKRKLGGNPRRVRMLAGRVLCPECGAGMNVLHTPRRNDANQDSYVCGRYRKTMENLGRPACLPTYYPVSVTEAAVVSALIDALTRPEVIGAAIRAALAAYAEALPGAADGGEELERTEAALAELARKQAAAVQGQIAGIMAGADPAAYAAVFAEIAEARAALEARRRDLSARKAPARGGAPTAADFPRLLADVRRVLESPQVPDADKRAALGALVESVTPLKCGEAYQREGAFGARVAFLPGALGYMSETCQASGKKCCLNFIVA